ncbi:MAG: DUF5693 family protein [Synergistaceae bacterium]|jgi:hypothetical protein|nr:DUF5693 family protein [Synergistaceae bacterium]
MSERWDEEDEVEENEEVLSWNERFDALKSQYMRADRFFIILMLIALALSSGGIYRRLSVEWRRLTVAVVMEYRDIASLARQSGGTPEAVYSSLYERGVRGVTVQEFTGKDLSGGAMPLSYGSLASFQPAIRTDVQQSLDRAAILVDNSEPSLPAIIDYLSIRMPIEKYARSGQTLIVLPATTDELGDSGLLPDFRAMDFAESRRAASLYRPAPASDVNGEAIAASMLWLKNKYESFSCVIPAGQIVAGYPHLAPIARALKEARVPVAQAEFARQIGAPALYSAMKPDLLPLHSLVRDELISRAMSREQVVERMVRAVHERSIRIILMRPYDMYSTGKLPFLLEDLGKIHDSLTSRGYSFGWPRTIPLFTASVFSAIGVAMAFSACLWFHLRRYSLFAAMGAMKIEILVIPLFAVVVGLLAWKISIVSRAMGGFCAALIATEATIWALDRYSKPFAGLLAGILIVFAGGLSIAAFYGTTAAMLRLAPFSGVKLTLLLPPILILANDFKQRVHPESLLEIMSRPSLWGELFLVGCLLVAAAVLTIRSDNVSFVPGWEVQFRDMLERVLWVRPRTKEFLVGYPCLVIYHALVRRGWAAHYREVFRVGASLAFASAVNTFCHFHTLLPLSVVRVVNGWWLGLVVGFIALVTLDYIGGPIWRKGGREIFD